MSYGVDIDKAWFQQDGTRPHTAGIVLDFLKGISRNRFLMFVVEVLSGHLCHLI
jgi:hypothetical protein